MIHGACQIRRPNERTNERRREQAVSPESVSHRLTGGVWSAAESERRVTRPPDRPGSALKKLLFCPVCHYRRVIICGVCRSSRYRWFFTNKLQTQQQTKLP